MTVENCSLKAKIWGLTPNKRVFWGQRTRSAIAGAVVVRPSEGGSKDVDDDEYDRQAADRCIVPTYIHKNEDDDHDSNSQ